jgi:hypothetical protein
MKSLARIMIAFCMLGYGFSLRAQNAVPSAGGNGSGPGGTISYSAGQIVNATIQHSAGTITQGVQQPFEILVVTDIKEASGILLEVSVYPNPATDFIKLIIENYETLNLRFQLYDINGVVIRNSKIETAETNIIMSNLAPGTYFLKVTDKNLTVKTFKIIKY